MFTLRICRFASRLSALAVFALLINSTAARAQQPLPDPTVQPGVPGPGKTVEGEDKHVFGVLPNYRTAEMSAAAEPLTSQQKMHIAIKDTFDYPLLGTSAVLAGLYHLENSHPQFGQGAKGYFHRLSTSYADQLVGNFMTEGLLPIAFREDPRYFRMATGTNSHRFFYAISRTLITRTDAGGYSPNFAELVGNGVAAGVGLSYYSDSRNAPDFVKNWGIQLMTDSFSQVLKEFWPDIKRHWAAKRDHNADPMLAAQHQ